MKSFTINKNDAGQRIDKFVLKVTCGLPKSLMYKAIRTKKIKINRKRCEINTLLCEGDTVDMFLSPDFFGEKESSFKNLTPKLDIVYEDENIIICDKPDSLSCHSDEKQKTGTLIDHIKAYLYRSGKYDPDAENSFAPALCNRIDRNTTGLVVCALNADSLREMNLLFKERKTQKKYKALAYGKFDKKHGIITSYLKKDSDLNRVFVSDTPKKDHLTAITEYEVLRYDETKDISLLSVTLHTGRTHQIRAQLAHIGHPLVGDSKYGKKREGGEFRFQALKSDSISFLPDPDSFFSYLCGKTFYSAEDKRFV